MCVRAECICISIPVCVCVIVCPRGSSRHFKPVLIAICISVIYWYVTVPGAAGGPVIWRRVCMSVCESAHVL